MEAPTASSTRASPVASAAVKGVETVSDPSPRERKDALFEQFARITKALASPRRLEIVDVLAQGERSVESLADALGQSLANTSRHLQALRAAHLVAVRREGLYAYYRLADDEVVDLWRAVRHLGERRLADVERAARAYLGDTASLRTLDAAELSALLATDQVVLLDVRPEEEYRAAHIPGARSMPVDRLAERLPELPPDLPVVAYCRGPYCVMSIDALALLEASGRRGYRLEAGVPEWRAAGRPVAEARADA